MQARNLATVNDGHCWVHLKLSNGSEAALRQGKPSRHVLMLCCWQCMQTIQYGQRIWLLLSWCCRNSEHLGDCCTPALLSWIHPIHSPQIMLSFSEHFPQQPAVNKPTIELEHCPKVWRTSALQGPIKDLRHSGTSTNLKAAKQS